MQEVILKYLQEIEVKEQVKILFAVESGSRAWGFESKNSDYDVRFIYLRPKKEYLKLNKNRDVIEYILTDDLDINGWDLDKALKLLHSSNPTLFEWLNSPIIYYQTPAMQKLKELAKQFFNPKAEVFHYLNMAKHNYVMYIYNRNQFSFKKYFYVLRPLLAALWVINQRTMPPIIFYQLVDRELNPDLKDIVNHLLELKKNSNETTKINKIEKINHYIDEQLVYIKAKAGLLPELILDIDLLNEFFIESLGEFYD